VLIAVSRSTQPRHGSWFCADAMANIVEYATGKAYQDSCFGCPEPRCLVPYSFLSVSNTANAF
jgi:hypothetical protein